MTLFTVPLFTVEDGKVKFMPVDAMKKKGLYEEIKIRCRYCDLKDMCHLRARKEQLEAQGVMTKCPFTPNRPKKKKKK
jgi:hypothetical protein